MPGFKIGFNMSDKHEQAFNGDFTNISKVAANAKYNKWKASLAFGNYWTHEDGEHKSVPLLETKIGYDLGKDWNISTRYRRHGKVDQYRATVGTEKNLDKNGRSSISAEGYVNFKNDGSKWKEKAGIEVGYEHNLNKNLSIYGGVEQCVPLDKSVLKEMSNLDNMTFNINLRYKF